MDGSKESQTRHKKKVTKVHRKLRKVFVDGLSKGTSEETIYNHFRIFGDIEEVAKFQHRSDPNKCYAFVVFEHAFSCRAATRDPAPAVGNDVVYCALAAIGERFSGFNYFKKMNMLTDDRDKEHKKKENRHSKSNKKQNKHDVENFSRTASAPALRSLNSGPMSEPDIYGRSPRFNLRVDVSQPVLPVYSGYSQYSPTGSYSAGAIRYLSAQPQQPAHYTATPPPSYHLSSQSVDYVPHQSPYSVSYSSQYSVSPQISMSSSRHSYLMSRTPTYTPGGSVALTPPIPRRRPMVLTPPTEPLRLSDMDYPYFQPLTNTD